MIPAGRQTDGGPFAPPTNEELAGGGLFEIEERTAPGPPGAPEVPLLFCRPTAATAPRPIVCAIHGGGMVTGSHRLGLPRARDRAGPRAIGQVLMCPMLDDRNDTPSAHQMAGLGVWDRTSNDTGWSALLGAARGTADVSPYAAPARADDLSGLPPAFIDVGSAETFRDEDVAHASRIRQAGGSAELHVWPGGFHGFDGLVPQAALSRDARAARLRWLRRLLGE